LTVIYIVLWFDIIAREFENFGCKQIGDMGIL
jgi:hypothetical protein